MKAGWVMKNGCGGGGGGGGVVIWWGWEGGGSGGRRGGGGLGFCGKWVFAFDRDPKLKSEDQEAGWEKSAEGKQTSFVDKTNITRNIQRSIQLWITEMHTNTRQYHNMRLSN